jgi:hypothetical protein
MMMECKTGLKGTNLDIPSVELFRTRRITDDEDVSLAKDFFTFTP